MAEIAHERSKRRFRGFATALAGAALTGLFAGCGRPGADSAAVGNSQPEVIATVNGVPIDRDQMYAEMEQYIPAQLEDFPNNPLLGVSAGRVSLQHLITNELAIQLAQGSQAPVTGDEIEQRYEDIKMVKESQSTRTFEDLLSDEGMTVDTFKKENIEPEVAQYNVLAKGITVTDQELRNAYRTHIADYTEPVRVHIERVVLPDEAAARQAYSAAAKTSSLDSVIDQNVAPPFAGGDNSADIAQWVGVNQSGLLRPVMGFAVKAQPGTVLPPIKVGAQWWLVYLVDRRPEDVIPFEKVRHIVAWNYIMAKANAAGNVQRMQNEMQDFTQQAVINVKPPQYVSLVKQLKNPPLFNDETGRTGPPGS